MHYWNSWCRELVVVAAICAAGSPAFAISFTNSYTDGGSWRTIYAQGFKPSVSPSPDPGLGADGHGAPRPVPIF